jgi:hypothetical protein
MNTLELHFNAFHLCNLTYENNAYRFVLNKESKQLLVKAGITIALFETNQTEVVSDTLPLVFENFLPKDKEKQQLLEELGMKKDASHFEKLLYISTLNLSKKGFWLKAK